MEEIIGTLLIASPFISLAIFCFIKGGWRAVACVFGASGLAVSAIVAGVYLIGG